MFDDIPLTTPVVIAYSILKKLTKKEQKTREVHHEEESHEVNHEAETHRE
jgi:hypothetical protein